MSEYESRWQVAEAAQRAGGPAGLIFDAGLSPGDLPADTPDDVAEAVARLATQGAADLGTFRAWLEGCTGDSDFVRIWMPRGAWVFEAPSRLGAAEAYLMRWSARMLDAGATGIVIDLAATVTVDDTALCVIAGVAAGTRLAGGQLALAAASAPVAPVARRLQAAGLTRAVPLCDTCEHAVTLVRAPAGTQTPR
jgi:anti-anti-sigma regulatory factor